MKNRKGFTLAELLGVLAILAVITVITVPLVNNYIKSSKEKAYNTQLEVIENAAKEWFVVNSTSVEFEDDTFFVNIEELKESEFLSSDDIINPITKENIEGCINITKNINTYSYKYSESCSLSVSKVFAYSGVVENYVIPKSGTYKFELTGAAGSIGNNYYSYSGYKPGNGAYLTFNVSLKQGDKLYLVVGGMGSTTTGNSSDGAAGAGGGGTFVFKKIGSITNSNYQFSKGYDNFEVLGVAAGGNGTCDLSYSSCSGNDGIADPYYSLSNFTDYSTRATLGSSSNVLGIMQFVSYDFQSSTYTRGNSTCTGGFGGGSCTDDSSSKGGGWAAYNSSAGSFTIGSNVVGENGVNDGNGSIIITKIG